MTCAVCLKLIVCCNYFEVLHLYKLPASTYFIQYKVRGGAFDLAVEVTTCVAVKFQHLRCSLIVKLSEKWQIEC